MLFSRSVQRTRLIIIITTKMDMVGQTDANRKEFNNNRNMRRITRRFVGQKDRHVTDTKQAAGHAKYASTANATRQTGSTRLFFPFSAFVVLVGHKPTQRLVGVLAIAEMEQEGLDVSSQRVNRLLA